MHDLKKNLERKREVIEKVRSLLDNPSIRQIEFYIKEYQTEWDNIGPTLQSEWKTVRSEFWEAVGKVYEKVQTHYDGIRSKLEKNKAEKQTLIDELKKLVEELPDKHKKWEEHTKRVLDIQQKWKAIGAVPKEVSEEMWTTFREAGNVFFDGKKAFYDTLKTAQDTNRQAKEKIVAEAEALLGKTNWKETTAAFIRLQKAWKEIPPARQKDERRLWTAFKKASDSFFSSKREFFDTREEREQEKPESQAKPYRRTQGICRRERKCNRKRRRRNRRE